MSKDIQTLIEREAEEIASKSLYPDKITNITVYSKACVNNYFKAGANFALSLFKWRKVSDELPDVRDEDFQVLGRQKNGEYKTIWVIKDSIPTIDVFNYHGVTEWMPISNIGD